MEFFRLFCPSVRNGPYTVARVPRIMTFIVPVVFVVFFTCLIISKVRKVIKLVRHVRQGIRVKENPSLNADEVRKDCRWRIICLPTGRICR